MEPISLSTDFGVPTSPSPEATQFPHVWLNRLRDVDLPEEGEIRFRYSRRRKVETETKQDETVDYELCLKAITDICDCEGKEDDGMSDEPRDADEALDRIMVDLKEDELKEKDEDY